MKAKTISVLAGVSAPLILGGIASAGFVGVKTVLKAPNPYGLFVCNVYAVFDRPDDEMIAVAGTPNQPLNIFVKQGKFFQDPRGAPLTAPFLQFLNNNPTLPYDTFATIGIKDDDLFTTLDDVSTTPGLAFGNDSLSTTNGSWFIIPSGPGNGGLGQPNQNGQVLIFQGSFFKDGIAKGIAGTMLVAFTSNGVVGVQAYVEFDHQIPTPGVLPLLGLAGLGRRRRRRRWGSPVENHRLSPCQRPNRTL